MGIGLHGGLFAPAQTHPGDYLAKAFRGRRRRVGAQNFQISPTTEVIIEGWRLKNSPNFSQGALPLGSDVKAADLDLSACGPDLTEHHADGGTFARAVVAEQAVDL